MKEPLIISAEFKELESIIQRVESDASWLRRVICFMLYYKRSCGAVTRTSVKRAVLDIFNANAHCQLNWLKFDWHREKYPMKTFEQAEALLNEERFREYDIEAYELMKKKYKQLEIFKTQTV